MKLMSMTGFRQVLAAGIVVMAGMSAGAARAADTYALDPVHSFVSFGIKHLGISTVYGRFNGPTGMLVLDSADAGKSALSVEVAAANVDTGVAKRDEHLKSADFFDVQKYPTISFVAESIKNEGENLLVTGKLSLHGVTKDVVVTLKKTGEGKDPWGGFRVGYSTTFNVKRSEYGMTFMQGAIGDDVALTFAFEAVKK